MKINIEEVINRDYSEHAELLNKKDSWMQPDYLDKKYLHYSQPHTEDYFTPAGVPFYLVHFKELSWLNLFPTIFVRDGLTSIAHFFFKYPTPNGVETTLILPIEAEELIPAAWLENCLLCDIKRYKDANLGKVETIYITGSICENTYNFKEVEKELRELKKNHQQKFKALLFDNIQLGNEYTPNSKQHNVHFYKMLFNIFGDDIEVLNWGESKEANYSNSAFFEINQNKLNFSDSFVTFNFISGGSLPLNSDRYLESDFTNNSLRVSKYHFLEFSHPTASPKSEELWSEIETLKSYVLTGEEHLVRTHKNFELVHLCTPEFESLILKRFKLK
ncbi:hypothetical protein A9Q84_19325 [Halobacteriovorax marinus]|uniref:Uncharacterized protein n=1 Tax=Halobacteriovorax marinus TaxID=97084 RepID=A0A1Y5F2T7_9BACT|nr:hypothetical protein A9Q84_19325 [Halobacteriovorax marinus]